MKKTAAIDIGHGKRNEEARKALAAVKKALHTNRGRVLWEPHWRQSSCSP
jgi:hypothetical protein